jgi:hypothetical protein
MTGEEKTLLPDKATAVEMLLPFDVTLKRAAQF